MKNKLFVFPIILFTFSICFFMFSFAASEYAFNSASGYTDNGSYIDFVSPSTKTDQLIENIYNSYGCTVKDTQGVVLKKDAFIGTGASVEKEGELQRSIVVKGDINGDGNVTSKDYITVKMVFNGTQSLSGHFFNAADINNDNKVNTTDYIKIKNYFNGIQKIIAYKDYPEDINEVIIDDNTTSVAIASDFHIDNDSYKQKTQIFSNAVKAYYTMAPGLDAICLNGDLVNGGYNRNIESYLPSQYSYLKSAVTLNVQSDTAVICTMGNHEWAVYDGVGGLPSDIKKYMFNLFESNLNPLGTSDETDAEFVTTTIVNNIIIFGVSPEDGNGGYVKAERYLKRIIPQMTEEHPGYPILIINHVPIKNTIISTRNNDMNPTSAASNILNMDPSYANWSTNFIDFLNNYSQVIYISGHTHDSIREPLSIWQEGFTCINDGIVDNGTSLLLTYNESADVIIIYRLNTQTGKLYSKPWTIEPSAGKAGFKYTDKRFDEAAAPVFKTGANMKIISKSTGSLKIFYNPAYAADKNDDGYVQSYVFRIYDKTTNLYLSIGNGAEVKGAYYRCYMGYNDIPISDPGTLTISNLGLKSGRSYTLEMFAWNPFYAQSETYKLDFTL